MAITSRGGADGRPLILAVRMQSSTVRATQGHPLILGVGRLSRSLE